MHKSFPVVYKAYFAEGGGDFRTVHNFSLSPIGRSKCNLWSDCPIIVENRQSSEVTASRDVG